MSILKSTQLRNSPFAHLVFWNYVYQHPVLFCKTGNNSLCCVMIIQIYELSCRYRLFKLRISKIASPTRKTMFTLFVPDENDWVMRMQIHSLLFEAMICFRVKLRWDLTRCQNVWCKRDEFVRASQLLLKMESFVLLLLLWRFIFTELVLINLNLKVFSDLFFADY